MILGGDGMGKYYISQKGYEKMYEEILNIDDQIDITNKRMGESARRDNDLRENPEFMELRVKAMYELPSKKEELKRKYSTAVIIQDTKEYKEFDGTTVVIGAEVTLEFDGDICTYLILGNDEGDLKNDILSCEAPISKALIGKKVGEVIRYDNVQIKILGVEIK